LQSLAASNSCSTVASDMTLIVIVAIRPLRSKPLNEYNGDVSTEMSCQKHRSGRCLVGRSSTGYTHVVAATVWVPLYAASPGYGGLV